YFSDAFVHRAIITIALFPVYTHAQSLNLSFPEIDNYSQQNDDRIFLHYVPDSTKLMDVYVEAGDTEERRHIYLRPNDLDRVRDAPYSFRSGINYSLSDALSMNFDARRRRPEQSVRLSTENDNARLRPNARPWEFRISVTYAWGKKN
ncbi:MAG: hypothetical protein K2Q12_10475, partial [Rickettsiales bacterium]|nr:hypothetical protein [Rickettsiales bacterium]